MKKNFVVLALSFMFVFSSAAEVFSTVSTVSTNNEVLLQSRVQEPTPTPAPSQESSPSQGGGQRPRPRH